MAAKIKLILLILKDIIQNGGNDIKKVLKVVVIILSVFFVIIAAVFSNFGIVIINIIFDFIFGDLVDVSHCYQVDQVKAQVNTIYAVDNTISEDEMEDFNDNYWSWGIETIETEDGEKEKRIKVCELLDEEEYFDVLRDDLGFDDEQIETAKEVYETYKSFLTGSEYVGTITGGAITLPNIIVTSCYGYRGDIGVEGATVYHLGIDMVSTSMINSPIYAFDDGVVIRSDYNSARGYVVDIQHEDYVTRYQHLYEQGLAVGTEVKQGDQIAVMGATGVGATHLHFEILVDGMAIDPAPILGGIYSASCGGG